MKDRELMDFLKKRRIELDLSLRDVANKVGVNASTITRWESGDIENMKRDKVNAYAKALGIHPAVIMGWEDPPTETTLEMTNYEKNIFLKYRALGHDQKALVDNMIETLYETRRT